MTQSANQQTRRLHNPSFLFLKSFFLNIVFLFSLLLLLTACSNQAEQAMRMDGKTMGTSYHITIASPPATLNAKALQAEIDAILLKVNEQMSTYMDDSQISTFNRLAPKQWMSVDPDFIQVLEHSKSLSKLSNGKFDITIGPLIELWGFGKSWHADIPSDDAIATAKAKTGWQSLKIDAASNKILKTKPLSLNVSAIAKGFGVDKVARHLDSYQLANYLVEIGGEIVVKGKNPKSQPWTLGIEKPSLQQGKTQQIIQVSNKAIATSGDYRNYFEQDGQRYSHTIDPQTGRPVKHQIGSVTVIADTAAAADGYATMLNVIGDVDQALKLAQDQHLAAYFILYSKEKGQAYNIKYSKAFAQYLTH